MTGPSFAWGLERSGQTTIPFAAKAVLKSIAAGGAPRSRLKSSGLLSRGGQYLRPIYRYRKIRNGRRVTAGLYLGRKSASNCSSYPSAPSKRFVNAGQNASFYIMVSGFPLILSVEQRWFANFLAHGSTLPLGLAQTNMAGSYQV